MTLRKILPFILIIIIITALFGPFKASADYLCVDEAGNTYTSKTACPTSDVIGNTQVGAANKENLNGSCNPLNWDTINCVLSAGTLIAEYAIWTPVNLFAAIGGYAMDKSISLTVTGTIFSGLANEENGVVAAGWGLSRDIVNIFLIFILLYIAIATILQLTGYGAKQLLATLIIIAFLVNFSGVITKLIIDASNVLAMGFYDSFEKGADGQIAISKTFKNAFNMEKIITADFEKVLKNAGTPQRDIYIVTFLTYILGAGIAAIAGFIFFVFAALFLIRMVVLLILLILAPLAFGAMVLPSTKAHAKKWWDTLFHQAFFAPAAMFMLWISAKMANSSFIKEIFTIPQTGMANMIADAQTKSMNWDSIAKFVIQFIIIAIMLIASIIVSKQMGAIGADAVQKGVTKGLRKAQGYAGKIGRKYSTMAVGRASEGLLKTGVGRVPIVGRGLAKLSGMEGERRKKQVAGYEKGYSNYSAAGLEALKNDPTIFGAKREALNKVIAQNEAKEKKKERKTEMKTEKARLEENLEAARASGNIMDVMVAQSKIQLFAHKVAESQFEDIEEKIKAVNKTAEETKTTAEKTAKTKETKPPTSKT